MTDQAANDPRPEWDLERELAALRSETSRSDDKWVGGDGEDLRRRQCKRDILDRRTGGRWYGSRGWLKRIKKCLACMSPHTLGSSTMLYYIYNGARYSEVRLFNELRLFGCQLSRFQLHNSIAEAHPHLDRALGLGIISYVDVEKAKGGLQDPFEAPGANIMMTE